MIYFIQSGEYVKVGYTSNIKNRYKKYVTENPNAVKLLGTINGGFDIEKEIHKKLVEYKHRGEWFVYNSSVSALINRFIIDYKDNVEPIVQKKRKDKYRHLKILNRMKNSATAAGYVDLSPEMRLDIIKEYSISDSTLSRYITKLIKLSKISRVGSLYEIL